MRVRKKGSSDRDRFRNDCTSQVQTDRQLSNEDGAAGILSDQIIGRGGDACVVRHPLRLVIVNGVIHLSRGRRAGHKLSSKGPSTEGQIRWVTNMLDVLAELPAQINELRWTIEFFFMMFKHRRSCRYHLSTCQRGVELQIYSGMIACMLRMLYTGRVPGIQTFRMFCHYVSGVAARRD